MTPTTWWDRLLWWLMVSFRPTQCKAEPPIYKGVAYCVRSKGHPGNHETHNGETF